MTQLNEFRFSKKLVDGKWLVCDPEGAVLPGFGRFDDEAGVDKKIAAIKGTGPARAPTKKGEPVTAENLNAVIDSLINERSEQAQVELHSYILKKFADLMEEPKYKQWKEGDKVRDKEGKEHVVDRQDDVKVFMKGQSNGHHHPNNLTAINESNEPNFSQVKAKMGKFMPEDEDLQDEYHELLGEKDSEGLADFLDDHADYGVMKRLAGCDFRMEDFVAYLLHK